MSALFLQIAISLDGFIEGPDRELDWLVEDPHFDAVATTTLESIDGMVFGRRAHGQIAAFWRAAAARPDPANAHLARQAVLMRDLPKYVLTRSGDTHGWENSVASTVDDVARLKARAARPIAVFAGAEAARALLPITDEIRLVQYPVLLGSGTPLFRSNTPRRRLERVSTQTLASGAVLTVDRLG